MARTLKFHPIRLAREPGLRPRSERVLDGPTPRKAPSLSSEVQQLSVPKTARREVGMALHNLRGLAIASLLMLHSSLAYLGSVQASSYPFDRPPYGWLAFPVLDHERWFGFDLFCAWQDVYLMGLMFFLSGIFTWPSLARDGAGKYFARRLLRLGAPFVLGVMIVMPVALYPVYRITNANPTFSGYLHDYLGLPFVPNGPMWFLWLLLAFNALTAGVHRFWPLKASMVGPLSDTVARRPTWMFATWLLIAAAAYAPLALVFTPWTWVTHGPIGVQFSRPLLYLVYFCSGLAVGAHGLGRGLLSQTGIAARNLKTLLAAAGASFLLWMGLTALGLHLGEAAPSVLRSCGRRELPARWRLQPAVPAGDWPAVWNRRTLAAARAPLRQRARGLFPALRARRVASVCAPGRPLACSGKRGRRLFRRGRHVPGRGRRRALTRRHGEGTREAQ